MDWPLWINHPLQIGGADPFEVQRVVWWHWCGKPREGATLVFHPRTELGAKLRPSKALRGAHAPNRGTRMCSRIPVMRKLSYPGNDGRLLVLTPRDPKKSKCPPFGPLSPGTRKIANRPFQTRVRPFGTHTLALPYHESSALGYRHSLSE